MHKRILSLAMALMLTLTVAPAVFAAETVEVKTMWDEPSGIKISGVISSTEEPVTDWHKSKDFYDYLETEPVTYYTENAPVTINGICDLAQYWWSDNVTKLPTNNTEEFEGEYMELINWTPIHLRLDIVLNQEGVYLIYTENYDESPVVFYVVVGGPAPAQPTPTPTPATAVTATGSASALVTTNNLVNVIPPNPTAGQDLMYTVQPGETLWGIVWNYYNTMNTAKINEVYAANAAYFKKTNNILETGAVITLPAKGLINPLTQGSLDGAAGMYLVSIGDTLGMIAKHFYGDANQWQKIYEANKDRVSLVGNSPMIYEKQWLVIPQ